MKRLLAVLVVAVSVVGLAVYLGGGSPGAGIPTIVRVARGDVIRKAAAVGRIEVVHEVPINSRNGGILTKVLVKSGERVEKGDPLAEVRPISNERTLLAAERGLEQARDVEETAREFAEGRHLASLVTRMVLGKRYTERQYRAAALARSQAEEGMNLLREGQVAVDGRVMDFVVRAPVSGNVLEIRQREGTPVVPASTYGSGTVFMTLADMSRLVFRGRVDEIDVGRLREGMTARIRVGAHPDLDLIGKLVEIGLKAHEVNNAVFFDVRVEIAPPEGVVLRSGYSAVAEIIVEERRNVLCLPERVIQFRQGRALVDVPRAGGGRIEKEIVAGLSDSLTVEVIEGLVEGAEVLERSVE